MTPWSLTPPYGVWVTDDWDSGTPDREVWGEILRVSKPGAHLLSFGFHRRYHRLVCDIEDAGWEIRDCLMWVYSGNAPRGVKVGLVTPPGGRVLDPFCGSGSTGKACVLEGARFTGIEINPEYVEIARARVAHEERIRRCGVE